MWWLSFRHGGVVVIKASTLVHARLLAARNGLGRASHFAEGHFVDPTRTTSIPAEYVGRMLSPIEARQLVDLLYPQPQAQDTGRQWKSKPSSRRRS